MQANFDDARLTFLDALDQWSGNVVPTLAGTIFHFRRYIRPGWFNPTDLNGISFNIPGSLDFLKAANSVMKDIDTPHVIVYLSMTKNRKAYWTWRIPRSATELSVQLASRILETEITHIEQKRPGRTYVGDSLLTIAELRDTLGNRKPELKYFNITDTPYTRFRQLVPDGYLWYIGFTSDWHIVMDGNGVFGLLFRRGIDADGTERYGLRRLQGDLEEILYWTIIE